MLQCGGGNNVTSALLKEYFSSEKACQLNSLNATIKYRGSGGGILPCPTPHTDLNSMKKAASQSNTTKTLSSPRNATSVPKPPPIVKPLEASNGSSTENPLSSQVLSPYHTKAPSPRRNSSPRVHAHGKTGNFGRRNVEKEFFDTVSTGHIPCLSLPST